MAARAAAELAGEFQIQPKMIKGGGGVFDVTLDGKTVFSKAATGRFPVEGELSDLVAAMQGGGKTPS